MNALNQLFTELANRLEDKIYPSSDYLRFFPIEFLFRIFDLQDSFDSSYRGKDVFIPMGRETGMSYKVINQTGLSQLESGIVIPTELAKDSGLSHHKYKPNQEIYVIKVDERSSLLENLK